MKNTIKFFTSVIFITASVVSPKSAYAVVNSNINVRQNQVVQAIITASPTPTPTPTTMITIKPLKRIEIKVALKKTNAIKEIDRRLVSLNNLTAKISGVKRISATQKETLLAQVKIEIANLTDLKVKIEAETDATALQEEKKSITESYRTYALFIPKIEIIAHADKIIEVANAMAAKTTDSTLLAKISDSKTKAQSAIDLVMPLMPDQYPTFRTTLKTARDLLKTARTNLNTVYSALKPLNTP